MKTIPSTMPTNLYQRRKLGIKMLRGAEPLEWINIDKISPCTEDNMMNDKKEMINQFHRYRGHPSYSGSTLDLLANQQVKRLILCQGHDS